MLTAKSQPSSLSRNPKTPVIETNADRRVFDDGVQQVELSEAGRVVAGDDTVDLAKQIERLGLQVETIIPVHGRIGTLADLNGAVTERISKKE